MKFPQPQKARGIEEAWIVEYSFEVYNDAFSRWDTNNTNTLVVKKMGNGKIMVLRFAHNF
jgi:hypothetical protein